MPRKSDMRGIELVPVKYESDDMVTMSTPPVRALSKGSLVPIYVTAVNHNDAKQRIRYRYGLGRVENVHTDQVRIKLDRGIRKGYEVYVGVPDGSKRVVALSKRSRLRVMQAIREALGLKAHE